MNVQLDPKDQKALEALASQSGKDPGELLRELVREAIAERKVMGGVKAASRETMDPAYEPSRTDLGRKLRALSRKYVEGGGKLLTVDEINREVAESRGER